MKYLIIQELEKPYEENKKKIFEIAKERTSKGIDLNDITVFPEHQFLSGEIKRFMIVETDDPTRIGKWIIDYMTVSKFKVIPIIESKQVNELFKDN